MKTTKACGRFDCTYYNNKSVCKCSLKGGYADSYDCFVEVGEYAQWIDVNKFVPDQKQNVLMWCNDKKGDHIFDGFYIDEIFYSQGYKEQHPLAWMPRPKKPKFLK